MDPITLSLILAGGGELANIVGSLIGNSQAQGDQSAARQALQQALGNIQGVGVPNLRQLGPSAFSQIQDNPNLTADQLGSLSELGNVADSGGLTLQDEAVLNRILGQTSRANAAANANVRNVMQAQGMGGSGADLAAQLQNNSSAAENANQTGLGIAGQAQMRALEAMLQRGQLAGNMRAQDYNEAANRAQAQDMIARYNAALPEQQYAMQMARAQAMNGPLQQMANYYQNQAQATRNTWGGIGNGLMQFGMGAGSSVANPNGLGRYFQSSPGSTSSSSSAPYYLADPSSSTRNPMFDEQGNYINPGGY